MGRKEKNLGNLVEFIFLVDFLRGYLRGPQFDYPPMG